MFGSDLYRCWYYCIGKINGDVRCILITYQVLSSNDKVPQLCEDLLSSVDQPLKVAKDKTTGQEYLLCDYNRDGDSYR